MSGVEGGCWGVGSGNIDNIPWGNTLIRIFKYYFFLLFASFILTNYLFYSVYSDWTTRSWIAEFECSLCFLFTPLKNVSFAEDDGFGKKNKP